MVRYPEALEALEKAAVLDSGNLDAPLYLGIIHLEKGDKQQARFWLEKVLTLRPGHVEAQYYLGDIYFNEKKFDQALPFLQFVVQQAPDQSKAYYLLALTYSRLKQTDRAREALQTFKRLEALERSQKRRTTYSTGPVLQGLDGDNHK